MLKLFASIFGIALFSLPSCNDKGIICTEEFAMVGITVSGQALDRCFTIRLSTSDTLSTNSFHFENWYTIATDELREDLRNRKENFRFYGLINDSVVVMEDYVIGADDCHIYKVSGRDSVAL